MEKLISELRRLYLPADAPAGDTLARHLRGEETLAVSLADGEGLSRAVLIPFRKTGEGGEHWTRLCAVANALQQDLGLPAPAVSISGDGAYGLWLSLEQPVPALQLAEFAALLGAAYVPDAELAGAACGPVELPPCLHRATGKWAAFIHPGMGASFADEAGLDMAPPAAGQAAFLEGLDSIGAEAFRQALGKLRPAPAVPAEPASAASSAGAARPVAEGLLLKDATLEDIVAYLHSKNIEPTFRHLLPR